ncbi:hypothetical protein FACS189467_3900 [Bacteroidia bacterium]|nr:hypothetical protein FACS189467_3900 [Bacteroidia bacterium]
MKTKIRFFSVLVVAFVCCVVTRVNAQNRGVDLFLVEQYDKAKDFFAQQLNSGGNVAEANYYLGEIAYIQGNTNQAKTYYEQGLAADPLYNLNKIGLLKFSIKNDAKAADKELSTLAKAEKKNVTALLAIAKIYHDNGLRENAEKMVITAEKADKKSPLVPMYNGDLKKIKDVGSAASEYEQAILKDRNYIVPYIKIAQIYVNINPTAALERLNEVLEMQPDNLLAKQYKARAHYNRGKFGYEEAIKIYAEIFDAERSPLNELTDYAASLFFVQRYDEAMKLMNKGLVKDANNFVLNRLLMYSALEKEDYEAGLPLAQKFFALPLQDNKYIARDFITYGDILLHLRQIDSATAKYTKAIEIASEKEDKELYEQISDKLNKAGAAIQAVAFFEKYVEMQMRDDAEVGAMDYIKLGQYLYKAANLVSKDTVSAGAPAQLAAYLAKADTAFATVSELVPDNSLSFMFRARVNALRDPNTETGLAKPHYEAALGIIMSKNEPTKYRKDLLEIYRYLSYYYYVQYEAKGDVKTQEKAAAKEQTLLYCNKTFELDPTNGIAKQLTDALTEQPKSAPAPKKKK